MIERTVYILLAGNRVSSRAWTVVSYVRRCGSVPLQRRRSQEDSDRRLLGRKVSCFQTYHDDMFSLGRFSILINYPPLQLLVRFRFPGFRLHPATLSRLSCGSKCCKTWCLYLFLYLES